MRTIYGSWLLDELVTRFGEGAIDRVVQHYECQRVSVPVKVSERLSNHLGADVAAWLVAERGGQLIAVPSKRHVQKKRRLAERNRDIQTSDLPAAKLAKKYGISQRQIMTIKAQAAPSS